MDFMRYRHLKKLVNSTSSFVGFLNEVAKWPRRYGVPMWTRANYEWFYNKIKGGHQYAGMFPSKAA